MLLTPKNTSVFILAAGKGERMRPLTEHTPKPLLKVGELSLIEHHLKKISQHGFKDVIINVAYLGQQIIDKLGDGEKYNLNIQYSNEKNTGALETAGGIRNALHLIKHPHFICVNADVWTDFDYSVLLENFNLNPKSNTLVLVKNPSHNLDGDFSFNKVSRKIENKDKLNTTFTFSGIGLYNKRDFEHLKIEKSPLAPLLRQWINENKLDGLVYSGIWIDIGTPDRLKELNKTIV